MFRANKNEKLEVVIFTSEKIDFKIKTVKRDMEENYIMMKGPTEEVFINIYASNIGAPKYMKQILMDIKVENVSNSIGRDFDTQLTSKNRSSRQKNNMEILTLNDSDQ